VGDLRAAYICGELEDKERNYHDVVSSVLDGAQSHIGKYPFISVKLRGARRLGEAKYGEEKNRGISSMRGADTSS
jgi:hypothetical protein